MIAQMYNMSAVLIYSDPYDDGFSRGTVFPDGPFRRDTGVQRGSAQLRNWIHLELVLFLFFCCLNSSLLSSRYISQFSGDPLTPGVAAVPDLDPSMRKYTIQNSTNIPKILVQPISYGDAQPLLQSLKGLS